MNLFFDKSNKPDDDLLKQGLGNSFELWEIIKNYTLSKFPDKFLAEWSFPGAKYGWSLRIKDNKIAIVYLLPRENFFQIGLVYGQNATDLILESNVNANIKTELRNARVYAEGRGIRIDVNNIDILEDIFQLIDFKIRQYYKITDLSDK